MSNLTRREALKTIGGATSLALGGSAAGTFRSDESASSGDAPPSGNRDSPFVGTWTASPQETPPADVLELPVQEFSDDTLRLMTRTSVGGQGIRIRLSNAFGADPLTISRASVGIRDTGPYIRSGTLTELTFAGDPGITIPPGGRVISDPVDLRVEAEQDLATNLYIESTGRPETWHRLPTKTSYVATAGDRTDTTSGDDFETSFPNWFYLEGVEVLAPETTGAIACVGNSITDGFASTIDANAAYPDFLAERVNDRESLRKSVLNAGISGNRVLNDSVLFGVNAVARFDRDVLTQTGITDVILLEGINDIGFQELDTAPFQPNTSVTAADIIDGYQQLIRRAHAQDVRIIGGTLTPFKGAAYYYEAGEEKRQTVNEFIRTSGAFDGVVDFDKAIRDPDDPEQIKPEFDSGDNLHPNDAGYEAMAEAVDLSLFQGRGRGRSAGGGRSGRGRSASS